MNLSGEVIKMRKVFAITMLIVLGVTLYLYYSHKLDRDPVIGTGIVEEKILPQAKQDYEGFLKQIKEYQKNPDQIAEFNCMLTKIIYSGALKEDEIRLLLKLQREYFTSPTLEKNPEGENADRLIAELSKYKELDLKIIGYKMIGPQYVEKEEGKPNMLIFNVIYYMNTTAEEGDVYKGYIYEQNKDKLWELKGFGQIDGFPIVN